MRKFAQSTRQVWLTLMLGACFVAAACGEDLASKPSRTGAAGAHAAPSRDAGVHDGSAGKSNMTDASASGGKAGFGGSTSNAGGSSDAGPRNGEAGAASAGGSDPEPGPSFPFNMLVIAEHDPNHAPFVAEASKWLDRLAAERNFKLKYVETPDSLSDAELEKYALIFQMNYVPYGWKQSARAAFEKYITEGKGGWVGLHHAGLYGPVVTSDTWDWYYEFFGKSNFKNYIAGFAEATVSLEEAKHPIFKGVPASFQVLKDEWYTWDKSPRANVRVLASVDEASYKPPSEVKMGDHPVIWTNEAYEARNLYIFIGHHPNLFENEAYMTLLENALFWAATPNQ